MDVVEIVAAKYQVDAQAQKYFAELQQMHNRCFPQNYQPDLVDLLICGLNVYTELQQRFYTTKQALDDYSIYELRSATQDGYPGQAVPAKLLQKIANVLKMNYEANKYAENSRVQCQRAEYLLYSYYTQTAQLRKNCELLTVECDKMRRDAILDHYLLGADQDDRQARCERYEAENVELTGFLSRACAAAKCDRNEQLEEAIKNLEDAKPLHLEIADLRQALEAADARCQILQNGANTFVHQVLELYKYLCDQRAIVISQLYAQRLQKIVVALEPAIKAVCKYVEQYMRNKHAIISGLREIDELRSKNRYLTERLAALYETVNTDVPLLYTMVEIQYKRLKRSAAEYRRIQLEIKEIELSLILEHKK